MVKQSKNKVKLEKKYKIVGRIPMAALRKIQEIMKLPGTVQTIRANAGNTVKHNHRHMEELDEQLAKLGLTKEDYAKFVTRNFNEIREGNTDNSLVLAVANEEIPNPVAAVHLNFELKENFWLVNSVHAIRTKDLERMKLIWKNKKEAAKPPFYFRSRPCYETACSACLLATQRTTKARCEGLGGFRHCKNTKLFENQTQKQRKTTVFMKHPRPLPLHRRHGVSYRCLAEGLRQEIVCF